MHSVRNFISCRMSVDFINCSYFIQIHKLALLSFALVLITRIAGSPASAHRLTLQPFGIAMYD
jgi:hypothetical protein